MSQTYQVAITATGEVRDAEGNLIETASALGVHEVTADQLRGFTDDELRAAGLDDQQITQIRNGDTT